MSYVIASNTKVHCNRIYIGPVLHTSEERHADLQATILHIAPRMMAQQQIADTTDHKTVLVVEDEAGLRFVISTVLRDYGDFNVVEAQNADEALLYLRSGGAADLVFTDIRMPGTIDGIALTRQVRQTFPDVKVVMTSGNLLQQELIPGVPFFAKPYDVDLVLAQMTAMLTGSDGGGPVSLS